MTRFYVQPRKADNDFEKLFSSFFGNSQFPMMNSACYTGKSFNPKVNVVELDDSIALTFELPGMEKSDIKVLVKDKHLTVSGERKIETEEKKDNYLHAEFASGSFSRSFNLPDYVEQDSVNADYKNGLLHITLAKKEESKPKEIEVKIS